MNSAYFSDNIWRKLTILDLNPSQYLILNKERELTTCTPSFFGKLAAHLAISNNKQIALYLIAHIKQTLGSETAYNARRVLEDNLKCGKPINISLFRTIAELRTKAIPEYTKLLMQQLSPTQQIFLNTYSNEYSNYTKIIIIKNIRKLSTCFNDFHNILEKLPSSYSDPISYMESRRAYGKFFSLTHKIISSIEKEVTATNSKVAEKCIYLALLDLDNYKILSCYKKLTSSYGYHIISTILYYLKHSDLLNSKLYSMFKHENIHYNLPDFYKNINNIIVILAAMIGKNPRSQRVILQHILKKADYELSKNKNSYTVMDKLLLHYINQEIKNKLAVDNTDTLTTAIEVCLATETCDILLAFFKGDKFLPGFTMGKPILLRKNINDNKQFIILVKSPLLEVFRHSRSKKISLNKNSYILFSITGVFKKSKKGYLVSALKIQIQNIQWIPK